MEIGLVLGGGGARGSAHVGALRALEERGHRVVALAGCSMGAMVGACYAAGMSPRRMIELAASVRRRDFLRPGEHGGLLGSEAIGEFLAEQLPDDFEDLRIPLQVTTVDLQQGELVILNSGPLVPALLASSAIPGLLSPVLVDGRVMGDGGLLNNLPVDVIRTMTTQPVVAVDVAAPPNRELVLEDSRGFMERVRSIIEWERRWLTIELFMKTFDIPQRVITEMRLSLQPPDLLVRPPLPLDLKLEDFNRFDEGVRIGYDAAIRALETAVLAVDRPGVGE
jgi:NTE family protein